MRRLRLLLPMVAVLASGAVLANPAYDQLVKLSETQRQNLFTKYLKFAGENCDAVIRTLFQGKDKRGNAFWNAGCRNGQAFVI